jgi:hypothetical protein
MNTGQMMLTLGAIFLLSMVILNVNRGLLWTNHTMSNNRIGILAVSIGTSIIEKAEGKAFDEKTVAAAQTYTTSLTAVASLGLDLDETHADSTFDDFDDFSCYTKSQPRLDVIEFDAAGIKKQIVFNTICKVSYVNANTPNTNATSQTWYKRLDVFVTSQDMTNNNFVQDTIKLSTIYSFWYILSE